MIAAIAAATVCAAVSLLRSAAPSARAAAVERVALAPGDTVLNDILTEGDIDEYVTVLPRGAVLTYSIGAAAPGRLQRAIGLFTENFGQLGLTPTGPSTVVSAPLATSGLHRFIAAGEGDSVGGYRLRFTARPGKLFTASGADDAAPAPVAVGAFAGATIDVALSWRGPAPVALASFSGPDGAPLVAPGAAVAKATSSLQRAFAVTMTGDQTATLTVPAGTTKWSAKFTVRTPAPQGVSRDLRTVGNPAPETLLLSDTFHPAVQIVGEEGAGNDVNLLASNTVPDGLFRDPRLGSCGLLPLPAGAVRETAVRYRLVCTNGMRIEVEDVVRDVQGRVASYEAVLVASPWGSGSSSLSDFTYDALNRATGWTEIRRFDATGRVHRLVFSSVARGGNGAAQTYRVDHTPPGGTVRSYFYGPYR